jgi:quercetin dioxygenase-like cupin family protein
MPDERTLFFSEQNPQCCPQRKARQTGFFLKKNSTSPMPDRVYVCGFCSKTKELTMLHKTYATHSASTVHESKHPVLDVFGPTVQFLTSPEESGGEFCLMKAVIPGDGFVPIHSHEGVESFFLISGELDVLMEEQGELRWRVLHPGDFVHVPGRVKHAFLNRSKEPAVTLVATTAKLGSFFREVGRPVTAGSKPAIPAPDELQHFLDVAGRYGYWLATSDENTAVGISIF